MNLGRDGAWSPSASNVSRVWKAAMNAISTDRPGESLISSISRSYTFCRSSSETKSISRTPSRYWLRSRIRSRQARHPPVPGL